MYAVLHSEAGGFEYTVGVPIRPQARAVSGLPAVSQAGAPAAGSAATAATAASAAAQQAAGGTTARPARHAAGLQQNMNLAGITPIGAGSSSGWSQGAFQPAAGGIAGATGGAPAAAAAASQAQRQPGPQAAAGAPGAAPAAQAPARNPYSAFNIPTAPIGPALAPGVAEALGINGLLRGRTAGNAPPGVPSVTGVMGGLARPGPAPGSGWDKFNKFYTILACGTFMALGIGGMLAFMLGFA